MISMAKLLEVLKANGVEITEEIEAKVMEEFVEKKEVELKDTEIADLKEQIKTRDTDIEELKKIDGAKLQEELTTLQGKYKAETEALQDKLNETEYNNALELELLGINAKDTNLVKTLLDKEKITFKDGKFEGLAEQVEKIKKEKDFLFNTDEQKETNSTYTYTPAGGGAAEKKVSTLNDAVAQAMGLE